MEKLIEALQILLKYGNPERPTDCRNETLTICGIAPKDVSEQDKTKLKNLGFIVSEGEDEDDVSCFISFRFGSA